MNHPGLQSSSKSTTQLDNQTHTYALRSQPALNEYPDLTLSLISTLSNKPNQASGIGKDYWLDDSSATKCRSCELPFTTFRRRHHCRICGKIFCSSCTSFIDGSKFNVRGLMRVCLPCAQLADRYEEYASSEEESIDETSEAPRKGDSPRKGTESSHKLKVESQSPSQRSRSASLEANVTPLPPPLLTIATTRQGEAVEIPRRRKGTQSILPPPSPSTSSTAASTLAFPPLSFTAVAANAASSIFNFANNYTQPAHEVSPSPGLSASTSSLPRITSLSPGNNTVPLPATPFAHTKLRMASEPPDTDDDPYIHAGTVYSDSSASDDDTASQQLTWSYQLPNTANPPKNSDTKSVLRRSRRRRESTFQKLRHRRLSRGGRVTSGYSLNSYGGAGASGNTSFPATFPSNFSSGFGNAAGFDIEFLDDFLRAGESHARQLLQELLTDKELEHLEEWTASLIRCLKKISSVSIEVNNTAGFDLPNYLKIKRIPGGSISDSCGVDGVVFSKNLPLKQMPRTIVSPRIMLITFPIEYEQHGVPEPQFSSLEPLIAQQNEYLKKLVARISALRPNIVLTTSTVNGYALKLLADSGIAVACEMKPQVMEKLARMTTADIIASIDKLALQPKLGRCGKFEARSYLYEGVIRTYFFFTGCNTSLGFTVVLRGSDKEVLGKVKECAALLSYVYFNVKLESGLMRDQCLEAPKYTEGKITGPLYSLQIASYNDIWDLVERRVLSSSPWVTFAAPDLLIDLKRIQDSINEDGKMYDDFDRKYQLLIGDKSLKDSKRQSSLQPYLDYWHIDQNADALPLGVEDLLKLVNANHQFRQSWLSYDLATTARQWDQFWAARRLGYFDANYHQNIVTLFSMVSAKNATPCVGPEIQLTDFYWENDFSLGQFIEHTCLHANDICTEGCGLTLREHYRTYVHGSGKVDVVLEESPQPTQGREDIILAWSLCKICQSKTAVLPLSGNAWKYSFGKYLELSFWCRGTKVKGSNCDHDFYRDQMHYFGFQGMALRIEYSEIETLGLIPPKFRVFWAPKYEIKIKLETYNMVLKKSKDLFDSVRERLNRVKLDSMTTEKVEAGQQRIKELKERVDKEQREVESLCKHIYCTTEPTNHLGLNSVIREVQELSSDWNTEFQDFAASFLPSEKDIRKITAFQLDRLFGREKENEEEEEEEVKEEKEQVKEEKEEKKEAIQSIQDWKSFWENQIENHQLERTGLPDLEFSSGKVKKLAEFFDAQEYFRQRDLEKKKMEKANSYMPKVITSKPRVEVYKDVNDAVEAKEELNDSDEIDKEVRGEVKGSDEVKEEQPEQPEKLSLLKSLTRFWEDRSASLWEPLAYPLDFSEHIFVDSDVIVREDEPSSIIAFCLSTSDYSSKLCEELGEKDVGGKNGEDDKGNEERQDEAGLENGGEAAAGTPLKQETPCSLESIMLKKGFHLKYQFEEGYSTISCKIFFAEQFEAFRRQCGVNDNFLRSLSRCVKWDSTGGKSGSAFLKTLDDRFIIKELSKTELEAFVQFAPSYFEYFAQALFHNLPTVLVKIFGFYQMQVKNTLPGGKSYTIDVLIMENLFYNRKTSRIFDLKGSMRNRHVEQTGKENEVLLDENMVEYIYESPLFVRENAKRLLRASLWNDTLFLAKMNVMDYSLVVGIDEENKELVVGIIDCIRTFTWDKKLESWVKEKGLVGGSGVGKEPTVITPKQYKNRFREAMERYILMAPGAFYQGTT
ncbi:DEKNAAC103110 [Brettanomyces naardenensis]|uniref:1-phosphatidylinositol-3-phosphate 5-kinase n=1 Tax=Brettanomyces naardenensis TaxID=13370 RepID=A0A448YMQ1_BRENA|nr:DEKNAAC103110 [Brettanomyces naardenensis]